MKHIPNLITSLNLVSGFIAVIFASRGDIISASWLIVFAMIFDFFDGFTARLLKAYSEIGKELDSLADLVSFGVAPAMIIFHLIGNSVSSDTLILLDEDPVNSVLLFLPVVMPVCAALRLAKFNIDVSQATVFKGLPTPANAIGVITIVLAANYTGSELLRSFTGSPLWLLAYTFILSLMMVIRMPLLSLKIKNFSFKGNEGRYILAGMIVICYAISGLIVLPLIIPLYIIASVIHFRIIKAE
ncbi:MAG TPA: CDP-diacylglycerol--serine O-phosphatidyltransferase [Bacteroidales bacterium]|nr:CDP-diacylglycerol--serine O-phosphatidyltransferase [Bacteroidales bacterium]